MIDNARVIPQSVQDRLLPEMRKLLGLEETIPEYTEVRALSPRTDQTTDTLGEGCAGDWDLLRDQGTSPFARWISFYNPNRISSTSLR